MNGKNKAGNRKRDIWVLPRWIVGFQIAISIILIVALGVFGCMFIQTQEKQSKLDALERRTEALELQSISNHQLNQPDTMLSIYSSIDERADAALNKTVTIIAVLLTVAMLFSGFIAFKAPMDIEKRLAESEKRFQEITLDSSTNLDILKERIAEMDTMNQTAFAVHGTRSNERKIEMLKNITQQSNNNYFPYWQLAWQYLIVKRWSDAIDAIDKAKEYGLDMVEVAICKGDIRYGQERYEDAIEEYDKALQRDTITPGGEAQLRLRRAAVYLKIDRLDNARIDCDCIIRENRQHYEALCLRERVLLLKAARPESDNVAEQLIKEAISDYCTGQKIIRSQEPGIQAIRSSAINQLVNTAPIKSILDGVLADVGSNEYRSILEQRLNQLLKSQLSASAQQKRKSNSNYASKNFNQFKR